MSTQATVQQTASDQPTPMTAGIHKGEVRDYAYKMFRLKLQQGGTLSRQDWIRAEREMIQEREESES